MILVVTLVVRVEALESFTRFECEAAKIMARHGGKIERAMRMAVEPSTQTFREIHWVSFASAEGFAAYRADEALKPWLSLRDAAVAKMEILSGEALSEPLYG